jgi:hypothetical protein
MLKGYVRLKLRHLNLANPSLSLLDTALFDSTQLCIHLRTIDFI